MAWWDSFGMLLLYSWLSDIEKYPQTSNIIHTLLGNRIVDLSDVVKASLTGVSALLQLNLRSRSNTWLQWIEQRQLQDKTRHIKVWGSGSFYTRGLMVTGKRITSMICWALICIHLPSKFIHCHYSHPSMNSCKCLKLNQYVHRRNVVMIGWGLIQYKDAILPV